MEKKDRNVMPGDSEIVTKKGFLISPPPQKRAKKPLASILNSDAGYKGEGSARADKNEARNENRNENKNEKRGENRGGRPDRQKTVRPVPTRHRTPAQTAAITQTRTETATEQKTTARTARRRRTVRKRARVRKTDKICRMTARKTVPSEDKTT